MKKAKQLIVIFLGQTERHKVQKTVTTTHCDLAVSMAGPESGQETHNSKTPLLFIHGNSSCKEVFKQQVAELSNDYLCISIDLPGHGKSQDAIDSVTTYCMTGYADAFLPTEHMALTAQEVLTEAETESYARAICGSSANYESFLGEAVRRTDGRARRLMM